MLVVWIKHQTEHLYCLSVQQIGCDVAI